MRLNGRVALITGAGSGIGQAIAQRFAKEGASVVINDVVERNGRDTEKQITEWGLNALYVPGDVSNREEVARLVKVGAEKWGKVDILVNNAGILRDARLLDMKESDWDRVLNVNLKGVFLCTQCVAPYMIEQRYGKILNIASRAFLGVAGQINYVASKGGVVSFTRGLALELMEYGINVNCVAPGLTSTPMVNQIEKERLDDLVRRLPMGKPCQPEDLANAALFLVSDEATFITGQTLLVDGGRSLGGGFLS